MSGKAKFLFMLALVLALAGFAFFVLTGHGTQFTTVQTLPDGSLLRLEEMKLSQGGHSFSSKGVTGWRLKAVGVLPRNWTSRLGWLPMGGSLSIGGWGLVMGTNLGMFTVYESKGKRAQGFTYTRLVVFDEQGNTFDGGTSMGTLGTSDGTLTLRIDGWVPPAFPRRGKTLGLRYFENKGKEWKQVAEFRAPNPASGNYPTWVAEPLPATKIDGDLSVTLENLKSGLSKPDHTRPAGSNEIAVTEATLRVTQAGRANDAWRPEAVEISDATGNHWKPYPHVVSVKHESDEDFFSFDGALWPGEAAWKMRFEFSRVADFEPDEICTFSEIIVPGTTQIITLDKTTNVAGSKLQLMAISGVDAEQPGSLKWVTVKKRVNISIRVNPIPPDRRLSLLKVTDEAGREAEITREPDWNSAERVYGFQIPEGAKQLSFTFAFHKSRFVEFLARPEFARSN
jgi:hypothetical protein